MTQARITTIPGGIAGTKATLKIMRMLARRFAVSLPIREKALQLVRHLPNKNFAAEACALHAFVRDSIRYTRDVDGVETLQTPLKTLQYGQGDCDDHATLLAALLLSIGHKVRFCAIGYNSFGSLEHVYLEAFIPLPIPGRWITLETTEPWRAGKLHKTPVNKLTVPV